MNEKEYYAEIEHIIKKQEINKRRRELEENNDTLMNYWNIGRLLVEAQGGEAKAKYGKGYSVSVLKYMCQFFILFQKGQTVVGQLNWSHYSVILPIIEISR